MRRTVVLGGLAALTLSAAAAPSIGGSAAARVIDRTFSCGVPSRAGVREVQVQASSGTRLLGDDSKWKHLASASVSHSQSGLGSVSAGNPLAPESGFRFPPQRLAIPARSDCRSESRVVFSKRGLSGGVASQLFDAHDCVAGRRVIIRFRAVFRDPTVLKPKTYGAGDRYLAASGTVTHGELGVWSQSGKPLAYAEALESGKSTLFTASGCVAD